MGLEKSFSQFIWMNKLKTDYPFDLNFAYVFFCPPQTKFG